ncbi:MAG: leucine-rich repeat domain-containing protein [Oscillospiraceae bacterium]|nr:leucine-rich repeat domain-containing protein [Oscillospiraceae bacterium]
MNGTGLGDLTLLARTAYAIMCFERYVGFVYSDVDFRPVAEMLWHTVDGSEPLSAAAKKIRDMTPEQLFSYKTYEAYQAAGHRSLTEDEYRTLTHILNKDDWTLNSIMKQICQLMSEYEGKTVKPGAPETLPYLVNIRSMLKTRAIELPDPELLQQYSFSHQEVPSNEELDWFGEPIDPAPLSLLGISGRCGEEPDDDEEPDLCEETEGCEESETQQNKDYGSNFSKTGEFSYNVNKRSFGKEEVEDVISGYEEYTKPSEEANGCKWEFIDDPDGTIITRFINSSLQKEVTIPSVLNGKPVIEVDNNAFSNDPNCGCMLIEKLIMADSIRRIGDNFFKSCTGIRQVVFPAALESIGHEAFRGASRLETISIGDHCQIIGDYFCADAVSLRTVHIGAGIDYIGEFTFYNTPAMMDFRCDGMLSELGYGSFWVNRWADKILFNPTTELLRFCKDNALLYRYVKRNPPPRLFFDPGIKYVYDFAFGGDAWHSGDGITDIYFPGAEKIGVQAFRKTPHATVHLSISRMQAAYGPDFEFTLKKICEPARVVFDQP